MDLLNKGCTKVIRNYTQLKLLCCKGDYGYDAAGLLSMRHVFNSGDFGSIQACYGKLSPTYRCKAKM